MLYCKILIQLACVEETTTKPSQWTARGQGKQVWGITASSLRMWSDGKTGQNLDTGCSGYSVLILHWVILLVETTLFFWRKQLKHLKFHRAGALTYMRWSSLKIVQDCFILHVCQQKVVYYLKKNKEMLTMETCFLPPWSFPSQVLDVCIFVPHHK